MRAEQSKVIGWSRNSRRFSTDEFEKEPAHPGDQPTGENERDRHEGDREPTGEDRRPQPKPDQCGDHPRPEAERDRRLRGLACARGVRSDGDGGDDPPITNGA